MADGIAPPAMGEAGLVVPDAPLPRMQSDADYAGFGPGTKYVDPQGQTRQKPWVMKTDRDPIYDRIPEGEIYTDPTGQRRRKPKYQGVGFTTQTLYDMAMTDKERENALAHGYDRDKIKSDKRTGELYVETSDPAVRLAPGRGNIATRVGAGTLGLAAPVGGAIVGSVGAGPWGTLGGALLGQSINDAVLIWTNVYDRSFVEQAATDVLAGGSALTGYGVGKGLATMAPALRTVPQVIAGQGPRAVANLLGANVNPEATRRAAELARQGVKTRPSAFMMEAPYLKKTVEEFDPTFRQQNVLQESARAHYEEKGGELLREMGVDVTEPLTKATVRPSAEAAGQALLKRAAAEAAAANVNLAQSAERVAAMRRSLPGQTQLHQDALAAARTAQQQAEQAADTALRAGFSEIERSVTGAIRAAGTNVMSGDLWHQVADAYKKLNFAIKGQARKMYEAADRAAGDIKPDIGNLSETADQFLKSLPGDFEKRHPNAVEWIKRFAGERGEDGEWIREPIQPTFGQLHNLRSILRHDIDYYSLTPDVREGAYRFFQNRVDRIIEASAQQHPQLAEAVGMLNRADAYYAKNIPRFNHQVVKTLTRALESGMPADATELAGLVMRDGRTELIRDVRKVVGRPLWSAIQAADIQTMLNESRTLVPGEINGAKFASQVLDRIKTGVLDAAYDPQTAKMLRAQAQRIAIMDGKLPITALPGDTVVSLIEKARLAADRTEQIAASDPLRALNGEIRRLSQETARAERGARQARGKDPLGFLYEPTALAVKSAEKILGSEDLIMATAERFGHNSEEFQMLRKVYAQRLLQRSVESTRTMLGKEFGKETEKIQQLMFPGITLERARKLASDMEFLLGGERAAADVGGSIAAMGRVLNPWSTIAGGGAVVKGLVAPFRLIPGRDFFGRYMLTKYYATMEWGVTHPAFLTWLEKGLNGGPAERAQVRRVWNTLWKPVGAGAGEMIGQEGRP